MDVNSRIGDEVAPEWIGRPTYLTVAQAAAYQTRLSGIDRSGDESW